MTAAPFEKWEGLGNDFVIVDAPLSIAEVRQVCDRRRGIGADGVLVVTRAEGASPPRMVVFNADGSRPEMCGNGLRCVAAYLEHAAETLLVSTDAGPRQCRVRRDGEGADVDVTMGQARFDAQIEVNVDGVARRFFTANVGNPHAISFEPLDPDRFESIGRAVEKAVAGGTNVELVRQTEEGFETIVWERGVGFTEACGTGACAVVAVACAQGRAKFGEPTRVGLPGGDLSIVVERGDTATSTGLIRMRGPARRVFTGVWGR